MDHNTREIDEITFGIYSPEEILKMSVCKIDNTKKTGYGSVYDPKMGTTDSSVVCETCKQNATYCPGHFGHIELNEPIVHPLYYKTVLSFLNCFCIKCYRLLITKDQIYLSGINKYKTQTRFEKIQEKLKKVDICCQPCEKDDICGKDQPKFKFTSSDSSYAMIYEEDGKTKTSIIMTVEEIKKIFDNILTEDIELLGFDPSLVHPRNFIITVLPVCPPADRPYVKADGKTCDDDLTIQYMEIIKANANLSDDQNIDKNGKRKKEPNEQDRVKARASLRFRILTTFNNGQGKAKHTTNGRAIKGIKERFTGKDGQIRNNLMGKRCCVSDTPILLYDTPTYKLAKDIVVGDRVIGDDGLPRTVISTITGESNLYTIKQSIGDNYSVSDEHILTLRYYSHGIIRWHMSTVKDPACWTMSWYDRMSRRVLFKKVDISLSKTKEQAYNEIKLLRDSINIDPVIDIDIKDYLRLPQTIKDLMLGIKLNTSVKWEYQKVLLNPRILGMWLGDVTNENNEQFNNRLFEYWEKLEYTNNEKIINKQYVFSNSLCKYRLINNKHIPDSYIKNDENIRLELLAGIIDTNGFVDVKKQIIGISRCFSDKVLIEDIHYLVCSLGFSARLLYHEFMTIIISGNGIERIPTLIQKRCKYSEKDISSCRIEVIEAGIGQFCGFEVDQNNRFLLGDFTVTHNCDHTARTVIGPDPTLRMGELAVPEDLAKILTIPVRVTSFNIEKLQQMVNDGYINTIHKPDGNTVIDLKRYRRGTRLIAGDIIIRDGKTINVVDGRELVKEGDKVIRDGKNIEKLKVSNRKYEIFLEWVIDRPLQDGDYVLLNRQPTEPLC